MHSFAVPFQWHAVGLVESTRGTSAETRLSNFGTEMYQTELEWELYIPMESARGVYDTATVCAGGWGCGTRATMQSRRCDWRRAIAPWATSWTVR